MHRTLTIVLFLCLCAPAPAAIYYVRTDGHDTATGANNTTDGTTGAWLTIQKAANTLVAGDVVHVQPGTYVERVTETTDGSAGNLIAYIADGAVTIRGGIYLNGATYTRWVGFRVSQETGSGTYNYEMVRVEDATGTELIDCILEYADAETLTLRGSSDVIVRGCTIQYAGYPTYPWTTAGVGKALVWIGGSTVATNCVIEYSQLGYSDDYINGGTSGNSMRYLTVRNCRFGPNIDSAAHNDSIQPNVTWQDILWEANWDEGSDLGVAYPSDGAHHSTWFEVAGRRTVYRGNVHVSQGSGLGSTSWDYNFVYHNVWHTNRWFVGVNSWTLYFHDTVATSTGNVARNNIFTYSTSAGANPITISGSSACDATHNLGYQNGAALPGSNNQTTDPLFVNWSRTNGDFHLTASSPAKDAGGAITTANGSGSSSATLTVAAAAEAFWPGDSITVGGTAATVSTVDSTTQITLASPISWDNGAAVLWAGRNDMGAYEYGAATLTAATISQNGTTYTVTPTGDCRGVWFYVDGVPTTWDATAPYSATIASGTVTAKAYALYAQANPVVNATPGAGPKATVGSGTLGVGTW